ncbi:MAG: DNA ligase [Planctomycetaceae bacterium]|nr:DNA ligase [Planctomycetales bacterium]MCB9925372.1 DNA ligase [Planctomycetaceae bacterium]
MPDLQDGESVKMQGSARQPYELKNVGGVYSCSCPAWRNQSLPIERRTCKHLRKLRGDTVEQQRIGQPLSPQRTIQPKATTPPLLLAKSWNEDHDPTDWWLSEKLDGVRAYWDGQQLISRQGNVYHAPSWFVAEFPKTPLDGELWLARKAFQRTVSIVRRHDDPDDWRRIAYLVFDAPGIEEPFEQRLTFLNETIRQSNSHVRVLSQHRCTGINHLRHELARIESLRGEGLMLRQPASRYEAGRSNTLLKVKTFHDAEARVVEHIAGRGRHKGRMGALRVVLPDGKQFSVGSGFTDAQRDVPPAIGATITFRYQELTDGGVPRFPTFVRVCETAPSVA